MADRYVSQQDAMRLLDCSKQELDRLMARGTISYVLLSPKVVRISLASVRRYIEKLQLGK